MRGGGGLQQLLGNLRGNGLVGGGRLRVRFRAPLQSLQECQRRRGSCGGGRRLGEVRQSCRRRSGAAAGLLGAGANPRGLGQGGRKARQHRTGRRGCGSLRDGAPSAANFNGAIPPQLPQGDAGFLGGLGPLLPLGDSRALLRQGRGDIVNPLLHAVLLGRRRLRLPQALDGLPQERRRCRRAQRQATQRFADDEPRGPPSALRLRRRVAALGRLLLLRLLDGLIIAQGLREPYVQRDSDLEAQELAPQLRRLRGEAEAADEERARGGNVAELQLAVCGQQPKVHFSGMKPQRLRDDGRHDLRTAASKAEVQMLVPHALVAFELPASRVEDPMAPADARQVTQGSPLVLALATSFPPEAVQGDLVLYVTQEVLLPRLRLLQLVLEVPSSLHDNPDLVIVEDALPPQVVQLRHHVLQRLLDILRHGCDHQAAGCRGGRSPAKDLAKGPGWAPPAPVRRVGPPTPPP
mmetsp:Transcript_6287/g.18056  ORF Transcript_6287/g.18056 Transcript_6287/m.18056 type:complete len:465 (+) Transcript_6287:771-2165(+)